MADLSGLKFKTRAKRRLAVLRNLELSNGNISIACRASRISRQTFYEWKQKHPDFADDVSEVEESLLDFSESMLHKNIADGKEASIFFHLKTKGKERGYVERTETEEVNSPWALLAERGLDEEDSE